MRAPPIGIERRRDTRGFNYVIRFEEPVQLEDGREPTKTVWFNARKGELRFQKQLDNVAAYMSRLISPVLRVGSHFFNDN